MVEIRQKQKVRITVTVDPDVAEFFREQEFNLSGHINFYLRQTMKNFDRLKSQQDADILRKAASHWFVLGGGR